MTEKVYITSKQLIEYFQKHDPEGVLPVVIESNVPITGMGLILDQDHYQKTEKINGKGKGERKLQIRLFTTIAKLL